MFYNTKLFQSIKCNIFQAAMDKTVKVPPHVVPTTTEAVKLFEENGGQLTTWPEFGVDPLSNEESLSSSRSQHFHSHFPDVSRWSKWQSNIVTKCNLVIQRSHLRVLSIAVINFRAIIFSVLLVEADQLNILHVITSFTSAQYLPAERKESINGSA